MYKKLLPLGLCFMILTLLFTGYNYSPKKSEAKVISKTYKKPKYVFLFIGDGMSHTQINAAQVYKGNNKHGEVSTKSLSFTQFPVAGVATTHDSTSFCPDSASTATAIASGVKTHSGVIGLDANKKTSVESITEIMKKSGKKIGIVSSVTLNHATPAAFYAHTASRGEYYDIANQLASSGFDYYGGGALSQPRGSKNDKEDAYKVIEKSGYKIANTKEEILNLNKSTGKVYAVNPTLQDSGSMPYAIDSKEGDLTLEDFVKKGIDVLDNENGFFMMAESGKIDWACHANDALTAIKDVLSFDNSIKIAMDFAKKHPDETLILATGDHETGGMSIGYSTTGYNTAFNILDKQKMSYIEFDSLIADMKKQNENLKFNDVMPIITEKFGLLLPSDSLASNKDNKDFVLTDYELKKLKDGFNESMKEKDKREKSQESDILYGGYDPLSISLTHIINNKAGIGWTSYAHTGTPVPVYASGAGADAFKGSYDNTDINKKLREVCGL